MLCAEHDSLRQELHAAVQNFRGSVRDLVVLVDNSTANPDFNLAHRRIRVAHRACEAVRDALEHHLAEHGCRIPKVARKAQPGPAKAGVDRMTDVAHLNGNDNEDVIPATGTTHP